MEWKVLGGARDLSVLSEVDFARSWTHNHVYVSFNYISKILSYIYYYVPSTFNVYHSQTILVLHIAEHKNYIKHILYKYT